MSRLRISPSHIFAAFALAAGLLVLTACFREASDATASISNRPRYTGNDPWTIDGVRPGQPFEEVKKLFGEPREIRGNNGPRTAFWAQNNLAVTIGPDDRVTEVMGSSLKAGGRTIVQSGSIEAEVVQVLGPGKVQKGYRPKGSGVISLGREHTGTTLIYENGGVQFELQVFGEAAGHYLARRPPPVR